MHGPLAFAPAAGGDMWTGDTRASARGQWSMPGRGPTTSSRRAARAHRALDLLAHAGEIRQRGRAPDDSPMPGKVRLSFAVQAGDKGGQGRALAMMEAMKMEHTIAAPAG